MITPSILGYRISSFTSVPNLILQSYIMCIFIRRGTIDYNIPMMQPCGKSNKKNILFIYTVLDKYNIWIEPKVFEYGRLRYYINYIKLIILIYIKYRETCNETVKICSKINIIKKKNSC